jgi:hypothetical protein
MSTVQVLMLTASVWEVPSLNLGQDRIMLFVEIYAVLEYYAALRDNCLPFHNNVFVPSSRVKKSKKKSDP